jgi:hypothetical protein
MASRPGRGRFYANPEVQTAMQPPQPPEPGECVRDDGSDIDEEGEEDGNNEDEEEREPGRSFFKNLLKLGPKLMRSLKKEPSANKGREDRRRLTKRRPA